jgi:hypothetical protein
MIFAMGEGMIDFLNNAYEFYQSLNISLTGLLAIAATLLLVMVIAMREAASWFFKVDDVKKELRHLRDAAAILESEIKVLQRLTLQMRLQPQVSTDSRTLDPNDKIKGSLPAQSQLSTPTASAVTAELASGLASELPKDPAVFGTGYSPSGKKAKAVRSDGFSITN